MNTIQSYTSASTSINSTRLPVIYKKINWKEFKKRTYRPVPVVLDFGCGKYTNHIKEFTESQGCKWWGYDPFNGYKWVDDHWNLMYESIDLIICSNVFNVIKEFPIITDIHSFLREKRQDGLTPYLIKIHEGNGGCVGKETKKGCWQRNEPTRNYICHDEIVYKGIILNPDDKYLLT